MLIQKGNLDDLMLLAASLPDGQKKNIISDACIRAAAVAGVVVTEREDFDELVRTPFVAAIEVALIKTSTPSSQPIPVNWISDSYYKHKDNLATLTHHWLFGAVHLNLCMIAEGQTNFEHIKAPMYEDREDITDYLNVLSGIGAQIAQRGGVGNSSTSMSCMNYSSLLNRGDLDKVILENRQRRTFKRHYTVLLAIYILVVFCFRELVLWYFPNRLLMLRCNALGSIVRHSALSTHLVH